jgi:hypothetical protein
VDLRLPGSRPVAGVSCRQVTPALVGFGVGFLPGVLEATAPITTHLHEHTIVESVRKRASVSVRAPHVHDAPRQARKLFEAPSRHGALSTYNP